ncbi:MAG TPA: AIPR family protein, partial [Thermoleophilia bacterium]
MKNITRYSNRQNAVRGRDFLTLEDEFQRLKQQLQKQHYYLEVQTDEYDVLPKVVKEPFPRSRLINAFDAAAETSLPPRADRPTSASG